MKRIIIVDDNECKEELNSFLNSNRKYIKHSSSLEEFLSQKDVLLDDLSQSSTEKLIINSDDQIRIIKLRDIMRIEGDEHQCEIHQINGEIQKTKKSIKQLATKLSHHHFCRVHNNHIINLILISHYNTKEFSHIEMANGVIIPVDQEKTKEIIEQIDIH